MAGNTSQPSIKRVWGIAKSPELKLTDEELHLLVQAHTGKDSIKALNKRELQTVIRVLGNMKDSAKKSERGRNRYSGSEVTENQRKKIYKLTQELGWDKPARVNGMCQKMFGVSAVEWLNYQQCHGRLSYQSSYTVQQLHLCRMCSGWMDATCRLLQSLCTAHP